MHPTQLMPACPLDLDRLVDVEVGTGLSTLELGVLVRLIRFAWRQQPPCTLPDDEASLAAVAGVTVEEWRRMQTRLLLALGTLPPHAEATTPRAGHPGRITLGHARRAFDDQAAKAAATNAIRSAAGKKGAEARWTQGPDGKRMANAWQTHAVAMAEPFPTPIARPREALERLNPELNLKAKRSSAEDSLSGRTLDAPAIAGAIYAGLEAQAAAKVDLWRKSQVEQIIREGIKPYVQSGRADRQVERDIRAIASTPHVTPAAAEIALDRVASRDQDPTKEPLRSAMGYLISALGAKADGQPLTPYLTDQPIVDRWDELARQVFDSSRTLEAARAAARRIDAATAAASGPRPGSVRHA